MGIAVINLSLLAESSPENRKKLVHMLLQSFATYGFVKVVGHGISDNTLEQLFDWTRRFFDLPKEVKESASRPPKGPNRGYISVGREKISGITDYMKHVRDPKLVEDVKESFDLGPRGDTVYPTPWPSGHDACAEFKIFMQSFFDSCLLLHHKILIVLEEALFLHSNELVSLCSAGNGEVRITHYPPLSISTLKTGGKFRIAEHTDVGILTLLFQDSVGGLEVEDQKSLAAGKDGKFIPVESKNLGEMIVNCGDTLQMWSADLLRSANHRVTYNRDLDADEGGDVILPSRYSVGFFGKANPEASIDPIAGLIGEGVEKETVEGKGKTAQEYYNFMHEKTYS